MSDITTRPTAPMNSVLTRNIEALERRRAKERATAAQQDKVAEAIANFAGSMLFVYLHFVVLVVWIAANLQWIPLLPAFDSTFVILATSASVESIFLSTFILIRQNRSAAAADRRSDLDVQISLLAEHEVTRVLSLCTDIASHLGITTGDAPDLRELKQDVAPEAVLNELEHSSQTWT